MSSRNMDEMLEKKADLREGTSPTNNSSIVEQQKQDEQLFVCSMNLSY